LNKNRENAVAENTKLMSIGRAAEKAGISRQSLQYYLMVGLLEPTEITPTGRRLFDQKAVDRIRLIKKLNDSGYPLRAIRELFMEGRTDLKGSSGE
jgi:MerR family copper efflux transcriptional regulator